MENKDEVVDTRVPKAEDVYMLQSMLIRSTGPLRLKEVASITGLPVNFVKKQYELLSIYDEGSDTIEIDPMYLHLIEEKRKQVEAKENKISILYDLLYEADSVLHGADSNLKDKVSYPVNYTLAQVGFKDDPKIYYLKYSLELYFGLNFAWVDYSTELSEILEKIDKPATALKN